MNEPVTRESVARPIPDAGSPSPSLRRTGLELLGASFAALLLELALIRWLPGRVRVIAYFPNLVLIAAFLGLGVGALARVRRSMVLGAGMLGVIGLGVALSRIAFTADMVNEHLWLLYYDLPANAPVVRGVVLPIALVFVAVALAFIPLGGEIAGRLQLFQSAGRSLPGYAVDLLGSLTGVLVFLVLAASGARPVWWFALALAAAAPLLDRSLRSRGIYAAAVLGLLILVHVTDHADRYSPYYAVRIDRPPTGGTALLTNGSLHQYILDLRVASTEAASPSLDLIRDGYRIPITIWPENQPGPS